MTLTSTSESKGYTVKNVQNVYEKVHVRTFYSIGGKKVLKKDWLKYRLNNPEPDPLYDIPSEYNTTAI